MHRQALGRERPWPVGFRLVQQHLQELRQAGLVAGEIEVPAIGGIVEAAQIFRIARSVGQHGIGGIRDQPRDQFLRAGQGRTDDRPIGHQPAHKHRFTSGAKRRQRCV